MTDTIDSYYDAGITYQCSLTAIWPDGSGARSFGQTLLVTLPWILQSVKFHMERGSTVITGALKAYLYRTVGAIPDALPTGAPLAESEAFDLEDLTTTPTWYELDFSELAVMDPDATYAIVVYSLDANVSGSVYPRLSAVTLGAHAGNGVLYTSTNAAWAAYATIDVMFTAYGIRSIMPVFRRRR